jgi:hypothetical protein
MDKIRRVMSPAKVDAAIRLILDDFAKIVLKRKLGINLIREEGDALLFRWHSREYQVQLVSSTGFVNNPINSRKKTRIIYIQNCSDYQLPPFSLVINMITKKSEVTSDAIYNSLRIFMIRYYGIITTFGSDGTCKINENNAKQEVD